MESEYGDGEIYTSRTPKETITVIPRAVEFTYDQDRDGGDVLGLLIEDSLTGPMLVVLNADTAKVIAAHLQAMLDRLPALRAEYRERNR